MPRADDVPSFKVVDPNTPCPSNPLGMKGCGEAGAIGSPPAVINAITDAIGNNESACRRRRKRCGWPRRAPPKKAAEEEKEMYATHYHRPKGLADAAKLFADAAEARYLAGGQTLIPTMKQRLASPSDLIDLAHIAELKGIEVSGETVTIGAATTHAEVAAVGSGQEGDARPRLPRRPDRRPACAPTRHDRRLDRQQRSCRRLSRGGAGARRHHPHQQAEIAADEFFTGLFETALEDGEIVTAVAFPVPARPATQSSPTRRRAMRSPACS